jgi:hypothetical protein
MSLIEKSRWRLSKEEMVGMAERHRARLTGSARTVRVIRLVPTVPWGWTAVRENKKGKQLKNLRHTAFRFLMMGGDENVTRIAASSGCSGLTDAVQTPHRRVGPPRRGLRGSCYCPERRSAYCLP